MYAYLVYVFMWVVLQNRVPLRIRFIRIPYYFWDPKRDPNFACMCVCMCAYARAFTSVHIHLSYNTHTHIYIEECVRVCMYACMHMHVRRMCADNVCRPTYIYMHMYRNLLLLYKSLKYLYSFIPPSFLPVTKPKCWPKLDWHAQGIREAFFHDRHHKVYHH